MRTPASRYFPHIGLPADIPHGFIDISWRNDSGVCFFNGPYSLLITEESPTDREDSDMARYTLLTSGNGREYETESWDDMLAHIRSLGL